MTWVLVSVTRTRDGYTFTVDGVARDGIECPRGLGLEEYSTVAARIEDAVRIDHMKLGRRVGCSLVLEAAR